MGRAFDPLAVDVPQLLSALGIEGEHRGDVWQAKCPSGLHVDHNPSWGIKDVPGESKHACHFCHSCKWGGTASQLVAKVLQITPYGARDWLLENAMGRVRVVSHLSLDIRSIRKQRMVFPEGVVIAPLDQWPTRAAKYVLDRGITVGQVDRWRIGYGVSGRLADRIVLPIWSGGTMPVLVHYTARSFAGSAAKYKSALRSEGFDDSAIFGEEFWPALADRELVVVVEGAFNALAIERILPVPLASLFGSNVSISHLNKLSSFSRVLVLTDPDLAGDRAAEKLIGALARNVVKCRGKIERLRLPSRTDANDLERSDRTAFRALLLDSIEKMRQ